MRHKRRWLVGVSSIRLNIDEELQGLIKLMFPINTGMNILHRGMLSLLLLNVLFCLHI